MSLQVVPITLKSAIEFVRLHHRHSSAPVGGLFAVAVAEGEQVRGVAIVGRPVARLLNDGFTAEVIRCCTDGVKNACSMLYGACWRAARAQGYRRLVTYTLSTEPGTSLKAAGWRVIATVRAKAWHCPSRPRVEHPLQEKLRWEVSA